MRNYHTIIQQAKKISLLYDEVRPELKSISVNIYNDLRNVFSTFDKEFNLNYNNIKYYNFTYRVKKTKSFNDKLHRKNIIFNLIKELNMSDLDQNKEILKTKIKTFDDNIGFRIICDLQEDVKNVHFLLKEKQKEFKKFVFINLDEQPKKMKNNHFIYKIEALYNNIPFELQIKNKFDSAWGDMEHHLYYKNNKINIVKEINKLSFNHIGIMLKQIDSYMSELRKMNQKALDNNMYVNDILILSQIESRYEIHLKEAIDDDFIYDFTNITKQLKFIVNDKIFQAGPVVHIKSMINDFLEQDLVRHDSWDIIILEAIYNDIVDNTKNSFINIYKEFIYDYLNITLEKQDLMFFIGLVYDKAINKKLGSEHLLKLEEYENLKHLGTFLVSGLSEFEGDIDKLNLFEYYGYKYFGIDNTVSEEDFKVSFDLDEINTFLENKLTKTKHNKLTKVEVERYNKIKSKLGLKNA